jgi:hypothetical protein
VPRPLRRAPPPSWPHPWPPPPHDPRERDFLCVAGPWQVRAFALYGPRFEYFAPRSLWHVQLWHPGAGVSILTPSALTGGCYELFPVRGWKQRVATEPLLRRTLEIAHHLAPPSPGTLQALEAYFVDDPVQAFLAARAPAPKPGA